MNSKSSAAVAVPEMRCDTALAITTFTRVTNHGARRAVTWNAFCHELNSEVTYRSKDHCPLVRLGTFEGNSRESSSKLLSVAALQADYDAGEISVAEAGRRLRVAGIRAAIYTTASHLRLDPPKYNGGPRFRVVAPLAAPVDEAGHEELMSLLNGALGGVLANESWDWRRCYYRGRVAGVAYETAVVDGECLDTIALCPDFDAIEPAVKPKPTRAMDLARASEDDDDVGAYMVANGHVLQRVTKGLHTTCPRKHQHSRGEISSTTWLFPTASEAARICCLHKSHRSPENGGPVTNAEFFAFIGFEEDLGFEVVHGDPGNAVEPPSPQHSDDQLALAFAGKVHLGLRYTPGMGWLAHGEHHWRRDDNLHRMTLARALCRDAAKQAERPNERKALASARTINAVVSLAQSDQRLLVPADAWDADAFALNTPAGLVNLRTGIVRPRLGDLVARVTRVSPDFAAAHPTWSGFLDSVCGGDAELVGFLQRMAGYLLTGDRREQKLFFIWGKGSNGKSTFGELLLWILGGYGLKLSSSVLMQSPHDRHPTELAQLQGARTAVSSELEEGQFFNESRVKELTGDDTLSARFMRGDFFEFAMTHKHLVIGNHKPRLKGGDPAMARRLVLVPFRAAFNGSAADPEMPAKLRAEAPAILAWMVRGAVDWAAGGLGIPPAVRSASEEYMADHNDVEQWLGDSCDMAPAEKEKASPLYDSFARWKLGRGERAPSAVTWAERMALISGLQRVRSNGSWWVGVRLRTGADADEFA